MNKNTKPQTEELNPDVENAIEYFRAFQHPVVQDVVRGLPRVGAGVLSAVLGTVGDFHQGSLAAMQWGERKVRRESREQYADRIRRGENSMPGPEVSAYWNSSQYLKGTENFTGPLYESKTPVGKLIQDTAELLPTIAVGSVGAKSAAKFYGGLLHRRLQDT
jgi:hypothetical protein